MKLHKYDSYTAYKRAQTKANRKKRWAQWVTEEEIMGAADTLLRKHDSVRFGLCHGTRRGNEQKWFTKYLNAEVLGTEISASATQFPNTIEWDFHDVKPEWVGSVDFVYSNALDHSYNPEMCLTQWMSCLKPGGYCILHWSTGHRTSNPWDPFGAELEEYRTMIDGLGYVIDEETPQNKKLLLWVRNYE